MRAQIQTIDFDFESFKQEYEETGSVNTEDLIDNLKENGCLDDFENSIISETVQIFISRCVKYINGVPVVDTQAVNEIFGDGYITEINQDYINHYARGIKK